MTAWHLFYAHHFEGNPSETIARLLKDKNSYILFDNKQHFHFKDCVFEREELDMVILELDVPEGHQLPPPLPLGSISVYLPKVTIIGYDGHGGKQIDVNCPTFHVSKEECCLARQYLHRVGFREDWYNGQRYCGEWYEDLTQPHFLPLKTHFAHGASGSPVVVPYKGKPLVIAMLIKGYPEFYWDLDDNDKRLIDERFIMKVAVKVSMFDMNESMDDSAEDMDWSETEDYMDTS
ncbi:uncharacterized protein [Haliotis asinina]|uniref:uncharacterized protein n=1 Tax=Haliotis asinina TaxID=109174 RepID=UPI003531B7BA